MPLSSFSLRLPRRLTPEMLAMDADGLTGQQLQDPTADVSAPPPTLPPAIQPPSVGDGTGGAAQSNLPPLITPPGAGSLNAGGTVQAPPSNLPPLVRPDPQSQQTIPASAFAGAGARQGVQDPLINRIAQEGLDAPPLPPKPSGWRQALGAAAAMFGGAAFDPLIEYGSKGAQQVRDYQRWQSELPKKIEIGQLVLDAAKVKAQDEDRDEIRKQREAQQIIADKLGRARLLEQQHAQPTEFQGGSFEVPVLPPLVTPASLASPADGEDGSVTPSGLPAKIVPLTVGPKVPYQLARPFTPPEKMQYPSVLPPKIDIGSLSVPQVGGSIVAPIGKVKRPGYFDTIPDPYTGAAMQAPTPGQITKEAQEAKNAELDTIPDIVAEGIGIPKGGRAKPETIEKYTDLYLKHLEGKNPTEVSLALQAAKGDPVKALELLAQTRKDSKIIVNNPAKEDKATLTSVIRKAYNDAGGDWAKVLEGARTMQYGDYNSDVAERATKMLQLPPTQQTKVTAADSTVDTATKAIGGIDAFVAAHPELVGSPLAHPINTGTRWLETLTGTEPADIGNLDQLLESIASLQPGQHGFRASGAADSFKRALGIDPRTGKSDGSRAWLVNPEKAKSALQSVIEFNKDLRENTLKNAGRGAGGSQPGTQIVVTAPDGSKHPFATQAQADEFKRVAGIR